MRRSPRADFERAPHRASSHPQSPINLSVKQILGLNGARITRRTDAWIRALREIDRDDPLAAGNTGEPHFIVKNSLGIVERRDPDPPRGRREDSRINTSQKSVFWCNDLPRDSQPRKIMSRRLFVAESRCLFFRRTVNSSRDGLYRDL